mgnify:CR=1 FL=1
MSRPAAVIVLAAGQGTRMKSALPKVVHPLAGLSMIGHALRAAHGLDPEHLVAVVRHQREVVAAEIARVSPTAIIADQDEIPGTGRAVQCGLEALDKAVEPVSGTIVVTYGDVPLLSTDTLAELVATHEGAGHAVTVLTSRVEDPTGYGRIIRDASGTVTAIVEQRDATLEQAAINEINAGIYAFDADFLRTSLASLGTDNDQGEVYLTDVVAAAYQAGKSTSALVVTDTWLVEGCNDRVQLAQLGAELNRRILEHWMRTGVTIVDPSSTWVDVTAELAQDVTLEQGVLVRGSTRIGQGARVGAYAILTDAVIPAGCVVTPFSQLDAGGAQG